MSAKSGGSFAALLMSGPLAAIPLMALFGIPQFASVSATTDPEADRVLRRPQEVIPETTGTLDLEGSVGTPMEPEPRSPDQSSLSAPTFRAVPPSSAWTGLSEPHSATPLSDSVVPQSPQESSWSDGSMDSPVGETSPKDATPRHTRPTPTTLATTPFPADPVPTWENAAQKLQELGIDDYRLERGQADDSYIFICQFVPGADGRVIRRFEAEATEPVVAVQTVIQRVIEWRQQTWTD